MKKLIFLCAFAVLMLAGCAQTTPVLTQKTEITTPEVQTDKIAEQNLIKISENDTFVYYKGAITIKGEYSEYKPDTIFGGMLCFYANKETAYLIPRDPNLYGKNNGDTRAPRFCFDNQQEAKKMFGINDANIFKGTVECLKGTAEIEVSNYTVNKKESAVRDSAKLEKIITKEAFSTDCKLTD